MADSGTDVNEENIYSPPCNRDICPSHEETPKEQSNGVFL